MDFFVTKFGWIVKILLFQKEILFRNFCTVSTVHCAESVFLDNIKDKCSARFIIEMQWCADGCLIGWWWYWFWVHGIFDYDSVKFDTVQTTFDTIKSHMDCNRLQFSRFVKTIFCMLLFSPATMAFFGHPLSPLTVICIHIFFVIHLIILSVCYLQLFNTRNSTQVPLYVMRCTRWECIFAKCNFYGIEQKTDYEQNCPEKKFRGAFPSKICIFISLERLNKWESVLYSDLVGFVCHKPLNWNSIQV